MKLYSIYYNDGENEKCEIVAASTKPTTEHARHYIGISVEGYSEEEIPEYITIEGVYETLVADINTLETVTVEVK